MTRCDAAGRVSTRGRRMLLELLEGTTQADLARQCRVRQRTISKLAAVGTTDSYATRRALERVGIPMAAWDVE